MSRKATRDLARRVDPRLREVLEASGLPWHIETGKRHRKLYVGGVLVTVISHGRGCESPSYIKQTVASVRRHLRDRGIDV